MAIEYKSIFDMQPVTKLLENDKFLVARGNDTWYSTKSTTYSSLSSDLADILQEIQFDVKIINDRGALAGGGSKATASASVISLIDNDLALIKQNFISKIEDQIVNTKWNFLEIPVYSAQYSTKTPSNAFATIGKASEIAEDASSRNVLFCHTFFDKDIAGKGFKLVDLIPKAKIPPSITVWASFNCTGTGARKPTFMVDNASEVARIEGTETIQTNHATYSRSNKYCAYVSGLDNPETLDSTVIRADNIAAAVICTIMVYAGKADFS